MQSLSTYSHHGTGNRHAYVVVHIFMLSYSLNYLPDAYVTKQRRC